MFLTLLALNASADTLSVCASGCDHATIGAAVEAASGGDTLAIGAGTYEEAVAVDISVVLDAEEGATLHGSLAFGEAIEAQVLDLGIVPSAGGTGVIVQGPARVTLSRLDVLGEGVETGQQGVRVVDGGDVAIVGGTYAGLVALNGAALSVTGTGSLADVTGAVFRDCTAERGGCVSVTTGGTATLTGTRVTGGTADVGGLLHVVGGDLVLDECDLSYGTAGDGGLILVDTGGTLTATGSTFSWGTATSRLGGGLYCYHGTVTLQDTAWTDASAPIEGGHVYLGTCTLGSTDDRFERGSAGTSGGALYATSSVVDLDGTVLRAGDATTAGGLYASSTKLVVTGATFAENVSSGYLGGALFAKGGTLTLTDSVLEGNRSTWATGTAYLDGLASVVARRNLICGSNAAEGIAAVKVTSITGTHEWTNNVFADGSATSGAAALQVEGSPLAEVRNNTFLGNATSGSAAVVTSGTAVDFRNNLVAWTEGGYAVQVLSGGTAIAYSNLYANTLGDWTGAVADEGGNLEVEPDLVAWEPGAPCVPASFALDVDSPLRDAGDPSLLDPDGSRSDIGAFGGPDADRSALDIDGDGFTGAEDCDDADALAHPGADERCNGLDDDCDDEVDEDLARFTWWADADGDGYGDPDWPSQGCDEPRAGFVDNDADCDDGDPRVHPGATEVPGEDVDRDCDGELTEA